MRLPTAKIYFLLFLACSISYTVLHAQTAPLTSSDTLKNSTLSRDTVASTPSGVDTVVTYLAKDSIVYSMSTRLMNLYGKSELRYKTIGLKAERVDVNWDNSTLGAHGVPDTSAKAAKKTIGAPVMIDGGETYHGSRIGYNFKTQKGKINVGDTEIEQGYFHGESIKKVDRDVLFVAGGRYTTCDAEQPHYYFYAPKMKVTLHNNVVAEPAYFYIEDVPIFVLPFAVFPNESGRRSGIIAPAYGDDTRKGKFLSHFGYYWAINDYMDASSTFDWFTRGGWLNRSMFRYALRYDFTGSVSVNYTNLHTGEPGDPGKTEQKDYNIQINHNQQIDPTTRLDVNFSFSSGSFFRNISSNLNEILQQNIVSTATLSKTWEEGSRSLTMSLYRDQNLLSGNVGERLPSFSFSQGQFYPFRSSSNSRSSAGDQGSEYNWYEMIGVNYSAQGELNRSKLFTVQPDNSTLEKDDARGGINHQISISASPKMGHFSISPFINYNEKWYNKSIEQGFETLNGRDTLIERDVNGFRAVRSFSTGLSASTRFFGIVQPQVFGITAIRHTVTPSLTLSFTPDFSGSNFGYFGSYVDTSGRTVRYDKFQRELYGGAGGGRQEALSFSVGNLFEMKLHSSDTSQQEQKIQLMNIGANLSYNFAADSLRLSQLSLSYRTDIGSFLSLSASTTHEFYAFDPVAKTRVNKFLWSRGQYWPDLTSVSFSASTSLSGEKKQSSSSGVPSRVSQEQQRAEGQITQPVQPRTFTGLYDTETPDFNIPWNLTLSYTFSQVQSDPSVKARSSSMNAALSFNLTEKWKFTGGGSYDFVRKEFAAPSVTVYRDLHCWEMNFSWFPIGFYRGYRLELRIKAPQLQDLKVTKQGSARGTYY